MRKGKRTTTPKQFEIIVGTLKNHSDLAVGCSNAAAIKAGRKVLWARLTDVLNQHGPPIRKCNEWKVIWSDYKYNLKRKLAAEHKLRRKNYHKCLPFNKTERTVLCMLGLRDAKTELYDTKADDEQSLPEETDETHFLLSHNEEVTDVEFIEENNDTKEGILPNNETDLTKEVPVIEESVEHLPPEEKNSQEAERDATVNDSATLNNTLMAMEKTQQAMLKELKESNTYKKQIILVNKRLLALEEEKLDQKKLQSYEENKQAYIKIDLKRKELELYEQKLKGLCTQCSQVKTEINL